MNIEERAKAKGRGDGNGRNTQETHRTGNRKHPFLCFNVPAFLPPFLPVNAEC